MTGFAPYWRTPDSVHYRIMTDRDKTDRHYLIDSMTWGWENDHGGLARALDQESTCIIFQTLLDQLTVPAALGYLPYSPPRKPSLLGALDHRRSPILLNYSTVCFPIISYVSTIYLLYYFHNIYAGQRAYDHGFRINGTTDNTPGIL